MQKKTKPPLPAGLEVNIANCVGYGTIVRRIAPNLYAVAFKGKEYECRRSALSLRPAMPGGRSVRA